MTIIKQLQYLCYTCAAGRVPTTRNMILHDIHSLRVKVIFLGVFLFIPPLFLCFDSITSAVPGI